MKPKLEIIEKNNSSVIYHLWEDIGDLNLYGRTKEIDRFLKSESKVMEKAISNEIRNILSDYGIIPSDESESALKVAFDTLNGKGKGIEIVDRNKKATGEQRVGISPNNMVAIVDRFYILSFAIEIKVVDLWTN